MIMRLITVTRETVLNHIIDRKASLDTKSIAAALSVDGKEISESAVRAAVIWLVHADYLVKTGKPVVRISEDKLGRKQYYKVYLYKYTGKPFPITTVRRNKEEREVQRWGENKEGGILLQEIIFGLRKNQK